MNPFLDITLRSLAVYGFMILGLRIFERTNFRSQCRRYHITFIDFECCSKCNGRSRYFFARRFGCGFGFVFSKFWIEKLMFKNSKIKDLIETQSF